MKVTANMLYYDTINGQEQFDKWHECMATPIVPRKMVEMIIEECERDEITNYKYGNYCAGDNLKHIREYAESLLKQFEEEGE